MPASIYSFNPEDGTKEYYLTVVPDVSSSFEDQLSSVFEIYNKALLDLNLSLNSGVYVTIYISDAANQESVVRDSIYVKELFEAKIASSVLQIPPMFSKIALLAYHIKPDAHYDIQRLLIRGVDSRYMGISVSNGHYQHNYLKNCLSSELGSNEEQAKWLLNALNNFCLDSKSQLENIVRTWLYVHDLDNNYEGMVKVRREIFKEWNLTENTQFPASTGIGGRVENSKHTLLIDAIIINGLEKEQFVRMEALSHMNPTIKYGVTFERGVQIKYGDRSHQYISGTASIDNKGEVVHKGDVIRQADRMLENVSVLLETSNSSLGEVAYFIVYLRDFSDAVTVNAHLSEKLPPNIPFLILHANVCRPGWLIEIDGISISGSGDSKYKCF
jgi:enamine deaminase RidA (YjgF/YER057c/UK114 family)